jgi:hypothetical protein
MTKEEVDKARKESEEAYIKYANIKAIYIDAEKDWLKKSRRFKDFDYQLALTDGRYKKLPPIAERKPKKQPELTLEQLQAIAAKLGVNISIETELSDKDSINSIMEETNEQTDVE